MEAVPASAIGAAFVFESLEGVFKQAKRAAPQKRLLSLLYAV